MGSKDVDAGSQEMTTFEYVGDFGSSFEPESIGKH